MARQQATFFMQAGIPMFSPIAYMAPIATESGMGGETEDGRNFWLEHDKVMLMNSRGIVVVRAESWEISEGIKKEINWAKKIRPIFYCDPDDQSDVLVKILSLYPRYTRGARMNQPPKSVLRKRREVALAASRDYLERNIDKESWRGAIILGEYKGTNS